MVAFDRFGANYQQSLLPAVGFLHINEALVLTSQKNIVCWTHNLTT